MDKFPVFKSANEDSEMFVFGKQGLLLNTFVCFIFISHIIAYLLSEYEWLSITAILINILFLYKFKNTLPVFILFTYIFLHTVTFSYFFIDKVSISYWVDFQTNPLMANVLLNNTSFISVLGLLVKSKYSKPSFDYNNLIPKSAFIFYFLYVICLFILVFSLKGENVFQSGGYGSISNVEKSSIYEYFILVFLFLILYAPNNNLYNVLCFCLLILYIYKTILYGGRIEVVQIVLLFYYLRYIFRREFKTLTVILLIFFGIYLSSIASNVRSNPQILVNNSLLELFVPSFFKETNVNIQYLSSTEGDVIQSSSRIIGLTTTSFLSWKQRLLSFGSYLISPIVPSSFLPEYSNLAAYKQDYYSSGGGGLVSSYFFAWLGYLGPIIVASFLAYIINMFFKSKNRYFFVYGLCVLVVFPRWFSYNPIFFVKFCLYGVILFWILNQFAYSLKEKYGL